MDIRPGMVFYLPFQRLYGQGGTDYSKYAIVARIEPALLLLLICTEIPPFARNNEKLVRSYIWIDVKTHAFLKYDSWVDCNDAKDEYSLESLEAVLKRDDRCFVGELSAEMLRAVIGGVDRSVRLERKKKASITSALSRVVNDKQAQEPFVASPLPPVRSE